MELIDKAKVVAEIEKRRKEAELNCGGYKSYNEHRCDDCTVDFYNEFLEIIDTLETKDIDFGCAVERYIEQIDKQSEKKSTDNLTQQEAMDIAVAKCFNEQEAVDKVEPKFNVDDLICNSACIVHIASIKDGMYYFDEGDGLNITFVDNNYHLWSIADAKDGDILYSPCCKLLWIYKDEKTCHVGSNLNYNSGSIVINKPICVPTDVHPATKEQRELLWQKMKEAGYMWDSDSKQLLSLKAEPNNEKKPAWSEEDENNLTDTCVAIRKFYHGTNGAQELVDWLQSLKERETWKPSDKQIRALRWVLNNIPYNTHKEEISGLLDQIKDL